MEEKWLRLFVRRVLIRFGEGDSYETAIAKVAQKKRLDPKEVTKLAVAVLQTCSAAQTDHAQAGTRSH